ncbi:hypothetical protein KFL_012670010, partial [Klebsormidium nitens]
MPRVWRPSPEASFPQGVAPITGMTEEKLQAELAQALEGIAAAREEEGEGDLSSRTKAVLVMREEFFFKGLKVQLYAPHILPRLVLASYSDTLSIAVAKHYREYPEELTQAFQLKEGPIVEEPLEEQGKVLTESDVPIAEWTDKPFLATRGEVEETLEGLMEKDEESVLERAAGMAAGPKVLGTASPILGEQAQD